MSKPYTVALQEASDIPVRERIAAEIRYANALERALGGPDAVAEVYAAWVAATETEASQLERQTAELAVPWPKAARTAAEAGFRNMGDIGEAHFEVRLERRGMHAHEAGTDVLS